MALYLRQNEELIDEDGSQNALNYDHLVADINCVKRILGPMNKFMFALDNIDHLEKLEYTRFLEFIVELSQSTKVKLLFTSDKFVPGMNDGDFGVKCLKRLSKQESVELFLTKIPLSDSDRQQYFEFSKIKELHEHTK